MQQPHSISGSEALQISSPSDPAEQEADRIAYDAVTQHTAPKKIERLGLSPRSMPAVMRQVRDAGPSDDPARRLRLACVIRLGGCTQSRPAGVPTDEEIRSYNDQCRQLRPYPEDVFPTDEECRNPPTEPLSTAEKVVIGLFLVAGAAVAIVVVVAAAEVVIPAAIAAVEAAGAGAASAIAFYYANAIVVNEIGLFAAGVIISCEGDIGGLLRTMVDDPLQAAVMLAEVYMLKVSIKVGSDPPRRARVPIMLEPPDAQTTPKRIKFKTVGPPIFETPESQTPAPAPPTQPRTVSPHEHDEAPIPPSAIVPPPRVMGPPAPRRLTDPSRGPLTKVEHEALAQVRQRFALPQQPTPGDSSIVGILILESGPPIPIHSGMFGGPSGGVHRGGIPRGPGSGATRYNITHVESHAAAIMTQRGAKQGMLLIEREPCASCAGYRRGQPETTVQTPNLTRLLPKDAQLLVVDGDSATYFRSAQ
jgi:hypothetical protein